MRTNLFQITLKPLKAFLDPINHYQSLYHPDLAINKMENKLLLDEHDEKKKTEDENNEANNGEETNGDDVEDFVDEEWKRAKPATSLDQISEAIKHKVCY